MDDTASRGNNSEVLEGILAPFKELESFFVSLKLEGFVLVLCILSSRYINLDRMVDDEVCWA